MAFTVQLHDLPINEILDESDKSKRAALMGQAVRLVPKSKPSGIEYFSPQESMRLATDEMTGRKGK